MFDQLLMQVANATNGAFSVAASDTIQSVAILISVVAPLVVFFANRFLTGKAREVAVEAGQVAMVGVQKATEAKDRIATGIDAFYQLAPQDAKAQLDATIPKLQSLKKEVEAGTAQVERIKDVIQPEFDPAKLSIPREDFETRPSTFRVLKKTVK
jgi:hypothetical protein